MVPFSQHTFGPGVARPITVLGETSASFLSAAIPTPVCDERGMVLGTFVPAPAKTPSWVTPELLAKREAEGGGRPLTDILRDLEAQRAK